MRAPLRTGAAILLLGLTALAVRPLAQRAPIGDAIREFVAVDAPVVALTHANVIDGTGAPARPDTTLILRDGLIAAMGPAASTPVPAGARVIDLSGKSVIPGLVMLHEHLYYPTGPGVYGQLGQSFVRLYLAGGVTTMRTGGNLNGFMDITLKQRVEAGEVAGPTIDATMPYVNGPNQFVQMNKVTTEERARRHVAYWADEGATSVKAYMQISRAALGTAIREAHTRGLKVTGHLCSVTYAEAAALGIDNLEHGFFAATDFVTDKKPDECPGQGRGQQTVADVDPKGVAFQTLVRTLIEKKVAITSTLTVFEAGMPARPVPPGLDVLVPQLREQFAQNRARAAASTTSVMPKLFPNAMALEREFARAGGLLVAGTDPTGGGGVIPGYSNQRQLELLVEAGFTPLEAITIGTRNGARYLGQESRIGTIAPGRQADLVVLGGDPSTAIGEVRKVETVFRRGVGFDPAKLIASVSGKVGLCDSRRDQGPGAGDQEVDRVLIPSIDLKAGRIVQLVQGEKLAVESTDVDGWIARFKRFPAVQLIDLDAAMATGNNDALVRYIAAKLPCRVGGGVRSAARANELIDAGATHVIVGSSLYRGARAGDPQDQYINLSFAQELVRSVGHKRIIGAVDSKAGQVVIHGWKTSLPITAVQAVRTLEPYCDEFLYTHVDREGLMQGTDMAAILAVANATSRQVIAAGGITTQAEIDELDQHGIHAVVGMAIYTGLLDVDAAVTE